MLLYGLLTGCHPMGDSIHAPAELVKAVVEQEPSRPSVVVDPVGAGESVLQRAAFRGSTPEKLRRTLRGDLDTIIFKALKKDPAERYSSVAAFADDLQNYLRNQPIRARPDTLTYRAAKFARRNSIAVVLAGLTVVASVTGAIATLSQARTARRQRDFALRQLLRAERITGLNELLLSEVAPSGRPITKHELLEREEHIVEREQYDDAADHAELLISIGAQYSGEEENVRARRLLDQAYQLSLKCSRCCHARESSMRIWLGVAPRSESLRRAEELFQSGLRELPRNRSSIQCACLVPYRRGGDCLSQWRRP